MSGKHTKAGRRASFRAYCTADHAEARRARAAKRRDRHLARQASRDIFRAFVRVGTLLFAGALADRVTGAA